MDRFGLPHGGFAKCDIYLYGAGTNALVETEGVTVCFLGSGTNALVETEGVTVCFVGAGTSALVWLG